ncbi:MAG: carbamoyl phosphate synthase small subunit [Clostridia bacterium]|nr:carbamoyl phosphate synthase small subunit [Clostridia bacterium]
MKKRYLVLQDGTAFEGYAFGADAENIGELVFSTNMVGYIETLTDPCYYGQIVMQTFPMVGNYGIIESDFIGQPRLQGYVVREWCEAPSNFRCEYDLDTFLKNNGIPGVYGVDTREITNIIRDGGTVNAKICDEIPADLDEIKNFKIVSAVENTGSKEKSEFVPAEGYKKHVAVVDLGSTKNMEQTLMEKGYKVTLLPYDFKAADVDADGVILSEGPGCPAANEGIIAEVKALMGRLPVFGIGLGHQIMALAMGASTEKLAYGHHGSNQPSKVVGTARTLITVQNHNYAVNKDSVKEGVISHLNGNDGTVEGIEYADKKAFSVQFEPDDALIEKFLKMMEE